MTKLDPKCKAYKVHINLYNPFGGVDNVVCPLIWCEDVYLQGNSWYGAFQADFNALINALPSYIDRDLLAECINYYIVHDDIRGEGTIPYNDMTSDPLDADIKYTWGVMFSLGFCDVPQQEV